MENKILRDGSNKERKIRSGIPTKSGIPTPKPSLKREATTLSKENVRFEPEPKIAKVNTITDIACGVMYIYYRVESIILGLGSKEKGGGKINYHN